MQMTNCWPVMVLWVQDKQEDKSLQLPVLFFIDIGPSSPPQGRSSSESRSSDEAGGEGLSLSGDHQVQTVVQGQAQGSGRPCRALSPGLEMETALQEMEMQTHQLDMCSPRCSPGEPGNATPPQKSWQICRKMLEMEKWSHLNSNLTSLNSHGMH